MISKTDFIAYLDAPRHLWAMKHDKIKKHELDAFLLHLFDQGYEVEKYADQYIKEHLIPLYSVEEYKLQPTAIDGNYEARTDVLIKNPKTNKWDMYEIKSSNKIDTNHIYDVTFQALVFEKHYDLGDIYILHLNKDYVRKGDLDLVELFVADNVTEKVKEVRDIVEQGRYDAYLVAKSESSTLGHWCYKPKDCPCKELCHPNLPEYSIFDVNRLSLSKKKLDDLVESGIFSVYDIPKEFPLSALQRTQVNVAQSKKTYIDTKAIKGLLNDLKYPLYFLDYESFNPAIPLFDGYKPFDQMTFQYSLHVKKTPEDTTLEHYEFLETDPIDTIPNLLNSLKDNIGTNGSIIVWNKSFECTQNKRMAEIYPEYESFIENVNSRVFDLMEIFQKLYYVDNSAKGSYSIKKILPIFDATLDYKAMSIGDGATAMSTWNNLVNKSGGEKEKTRNDLLRYCELDTLAMVKVLEGLEEILG
jgi:hypothetical protein